MFTSEFICQHPETEDSFNTAIALHNTGFKHSTVVRSITEDLKAHGIPQQQADAVIKTFLEGLNQ